MKPLALSHFWTAAALLAVGANCWRNWAGVRNLWYEALLGFDTSDANFIAVASLRQPRYKRNGTVWLGSGLTYVEAMEPSLAEAQIGSARGDQQLEGRGAACLEPEIRCKRVRAGVGLGIVTRGGETRER